MTLTYFNDITVYFHMKNHYKMLKNVKSVVDTRSPSLAMSNLEKRSKGAANEQLRKIYSSEGALLIKRRGLIKRHNCLNSQAKSEISLKGSSRPSTRRNQKVTPIKEFPLRSSSLLKIEKMKEKMDYSISSGEPHSDSFHLNLQCDKEDGDQAVPPNSKQNESKISEDSPATICPPSQNISESSQDQEYLLFLLRITEDIILHDFYTNSDIKNIFKKHIDRNKDILNMRKMYMHIGNLCKELNIDCKEFQSADVFDDIDCSNKFINSPEGHKFIVNSEAFQSCPDCSILRSSSLNNLDNTSTLDASFSHHLMESIGGGSPINPSLLKLLEKLSLGRVTECTEPAASTSTMNSPTRLNNNIGMDANIFKLKNEADNKTPMDFETFIKELKSKEVRTSLSDSAINDKDLIALESPPRVLNSTVIKEISIPENGFSSAASIKMEEEVLESENLNIKIDADNVGYDILCEPEFEKNSQTTVELPKENVTSNDTIKNDTEENISTVSKIPILIREKVAETSSEPVAQISSPKEDSLSPLVKLFLQGSPNEDDYVMIKGPIYVYKPLLESEPKLIIQNPEVQSRRSSIDSHKTFIVDHGHLVDQSVQYETESPHKSMENILELTKTAYSQFIDLKLLESDYDLTPEKDTNKYHHLLVDATTSISRMNLKERLLLSDDYLVESDGQQNTNLGETYVKCTPNISENNYVTSIPKLKKCSSESFSIDFQSQDSSLRSEGEKVLKLDCTKSDIIWYNKNSNFQ